MTRGFAEYTDALWPRAGLEVKAGDIVTVHSRTTHGKRA